MEKQAKTMTMKDKEEKILGYTSIKKKNNDYNHTKEIPHKSDYQTCKILMTGFSYGLAIKSPVSHLGVLEFEPCSFPASANPGVPDPSFDFG